MAKRVIKYGLNDRQERFCREYIIDLNGTRSAIAAGYSEKTATSIACRLLIEVNIKERIAYMQAHAAEMLGITASSILKDLETIKNRSMQAEPVMIWNPEARKMEHNGEYKFDSQGANKAAELLGKHLSMFTDKQQIDIQGDTTIKVNLIDDSDK